MTTTGPTRPAHPTGPTTPASPIDPTKPTNPTSPTNPTNPTLPPPAANFIAPCSPPTRGNGPSYEVRLRRPLIVGGASHVSGVPLTIAGTPVVQCGLYPAIDLRIRQVWNLQEVSTSDLASTLALAPGEKVTLEVFSSQRRTLEQTTMDSRESVRSNESTTSDKEAVNVTRASSKTEGWHVDATAHVGIPVANLTVNAGYSSSVTTSSQQTIDRISETTKKSAATLKTLQSVQVKSTSEGFTSNRTVRTFSNPYRDRALSLNFFQLVKRYAVGTNFDEFYLAIVVGDIELAFDDEFVVSNVDFLRTWLLDGQLIGALDTAVQGARGGVDPITTKKAAQIARDALYMLFGLPNIFNMGKTASGVDGNSIAIGFDAQSDTNFAGTALGDALNTHVGLPFVIMNSFYKMWMTTGAGAARVNEDDDFAIDLAASLGSSLAELVTKTFADETTDPAKAIVQNAFDDRQPSDALRRMPAFVAICTKRLMPLLDAAKLEKEAIAAQAEAAKTLDRLKAHLAANRSYYTTRWLAYVSESTLNFAITDFAKGIFHTPAALALTANLAAHGLEIDLSRAFVDGNSITVVGSVALDSLGVARLGIALGASRADAPTIPTNVVDDIEVPAEGVHLEVAGGACVLPDLPAMSPTLGLSLDALKASINGG